MNFVLKLVEKINRYDELIATVPFSTYSKYDRNTLNISFWNTSNLQTFVWQPVQPSVDITAQLSSFIEAGFKPFAFKVGNVFYTILVFFSSR